MQNCMNCFGCVGLKHKQYCILNVQYTEEGYEVLLPKIIEHMRSTGEWGEFFPITLSNFCYNESLAQDYFPIAEEEATCSAYLWLQPDTKEYQLSSWKIPDDISDVQDGIVGEALACESCKKNYKVIKQELSFYRKKGLPIPRECFECRYAMRRRAKNPRHLFSRPCSKCGQQLESTYAPDRAEMVYCEQCYLATVY